MLMPVVASKRHIRMMLVVLIGLLSGVICPALFAADESKFRVAIVGDSTVASYPNPPATGWGQDSHYSPSVC